MAAENLTEAVMVASGVAAYALAMATLSRLQRNDLLTAEEIVTIIEDALAGLDQVHARKPGVELHVARELLETSLQEWQARQSHED